MRAIAPSGVGGLQSFQSVDGSPIGSPRYRGGQHLEYFAIESSPKHPSELIGGRDDPGGEIGRRGAEGVRFVAASVALL